MSEESQPLMRRVLGDQPIHFWAHYPDDDARDAVTKSRWYYHVHEPGDRDPREHGHFHLFLHREQFDASAIPLAAPQEADAAPALMTHVAGLSIDRDGVPISWFVTNRWVTDEFIFPAETLISRLELYDVDRTEEDDLVNRFLTAMVALYREELATLIREREAKLAVLLSKRGPEAYESGNAVLASISIDLDAKIESLECCS